MGQFSISIFSRVHSVSKGPKWSNWSQRVSNGSIWFQIFPKWSKMIWNVIHKWSNMVQLGPIWSKMVLFGLKVLSNGWKLSKMVPTVPKWLQIGSQKYISNWSHIQPFVIYLPLRKYRIILAILTLYLPGISPSWPLSGLRWSPPIIECSVVNLELAWGLGGSWPHLTWYQTVQMCIVCVVCMVCIKYSLCSVYYRNMVKTR